LYTYIKGHYTKTIFQTTAGYHVGLFKIQETNDKDMEEYIGRSFTFTGYFHELNTIDTYIFYGKIVEHEKYGYQYQVNSYERCKPEEKDSIVEFLTSGLFKGIGEKKAKAIVEVLGKNTLKIILNQPDNLILIPGITKTNIDTLHKGLKDYESSYETILQLTNIGFTTKDSMIIYNTYKTNTMKTIEENIYKLIEDIKDMTFKKIDRIALGKGIEKDNPIRIQAAIIYIMEEISQTYGHCFYYEEEIENYLPRVLGIKIETSLYIETLFKLEENIKIIKNENIYYLKDMYNAECFIVKRFRMLNKEKILEIKKLDNEINNLEKILQITYNKDQLNAIKKSMEKKFLIITGGPGTGKTTIIKAVIELYRIINKLSYEKMQEKVALLAPTGRAAKRMSEATLYPACTIHRFLKWQKETDRFQINEYNKSNIEFLIIDEASMIDTYLMNHLLKGISANCKILLVGDDHQLPSVGPGQVLHDLIESKKLEVVELKELYRQGKDSNIITLAYDIRKKEINKDVFNKEKDLTFIECNPKELINKIKEVSNTYKNYNDKKFQILAPMYKGINGIDAINENVQDIFNPKKNQKEIKIGETLFREKDKVIQLTNMPDDNVFNGDIGTIQEIRITPKKEIIIDFDGNIVKYTPSNFNNFRLAYSISIHKSQGSEFDIVIIPITKAYNKMLYQKLIYTAVTRAKKKLIIIGELEALEYSAKNILDDTRRTTIKDYLINGIK